MWRYPKSNYRCSVLIQHCPTQKYLTIQPKNNNRITLKPQSQSDASIFDIYERQFTSNSKDNNSQSIKMIGFCNKCTRTWLGQSSFLGSVVCSARKFGSNEEFELDDDGVMSRTKILCTSANWGSGGWLNVVDYDNDTKESYFSFGGYDAASKKNASLWSLDVLSYDNS